MATFTGNPATNDVFQGTADPDLFLFNPGYLTLDDIINGNGGADTLRFTAAGTIAAAAMAKVANVETVQFVVGGTSLALNDAVLNVNGTIAGANRTLAVLASTGVDIVDASAVTLATRAIDVTSVGGGNDIFRGGAGNDIFRFHAVDLNASDIVQGNGGNDTLFLYNPAALSAAALGGVSGVETIRLNQGGSSLTLSNAVLNANGVISGANRTLIMLGSTGNDIVDASAVNLTTRIVDVTSGSGGNDTFRGGAGNDIFRFHATDLNASDVVQGNGGSDTLVLVNPAILAATALGGVTGVETVQFSLTGTSLSLNNAVLNANGVVSGANRTLAVLGSAGHDIVDASAVALANRAVDITSVGGGNDIFRGGAGNDIFRFHAVDLNASDIVQGNGGNDTLFLYNPAALSAAALGGVSGVETIRLNRGGSSLTLSNAVLNANGAISGANRTLIMLGSTGNDVVDASTVSLTTRAIDVTSGSGGNDTFRGGAGNDIFRFHATDLNASDVVQGNGGSDTLILVNPAVLTAASLGGVSGVELVELALGGANLSLGDALLNANGVANGANRTLTVRGSSGNDIVNASAVTLASRAIDVISGGSGNDTFRGGAGNDLFSFHATDLNAGDIVQGNGGNDTLILFNPAALSAAALGGVSGIESIRLKLGGTSLALNDAVLNANGVVSGANRTLVMLGTANDDRVDASAVTLATRAIDVIAGAGNDTLKGGAGDDIFRFNATDLNGADTVQGNGGSDRLVIGTGGLIAAATLVGSSGATGVRGVETIELTVGTMVYLNDAALANNTTATRTRIAIIGSAGDDQVNGEAATGTTRAFDVTAGTGNDRFDGTAGNDIFRFAIGQLNASDIVDGNGGGDSLALAGAGTIDFNALPNIAGIEAIVLDNNTHSLALSNDLILSAAGMTLAVTGGTGTDTLDISQFNSAAGGGFVQINLGAGADTLVDSSGSGQFGGPPPGRYGGTLGAGADTLRLTNSSSGAMNITLAGGTEADTIFLDNRNSSIATVMGAGLTEFETVNLVHTNAAVANGQMTFTANNSQGLVVNGQHAGDSYVINLGGANQTANGNAMGDTLGDALNGAEYVGQSFYGNGGDDTIEYDVYDAVQSGGAGTGDTLKVTTYGNFDLQAADQSLNTRISISGTFINGVVSITTSILPDGVATGFENLSFAGSLGSGSLKGTVGVNVLTGSAFNDTIDGRGGADVIVGGGGIDRIAYYGSEASIAATPGSGSTLAMNTAAFSVDLAEIDQTVSDTTAVSGFQHVDAAGLASSVTISGNSLSNSLIGGSLGDLLSGRDGDDVIVGGGGDDVVLGGAGNDRIAFLTSGNGSLHGEADIDTLLLASGATIDFGEGSQAPGSGINVTGFENVDASGSNEGVTLTGADAGTDNATINGGNWLRGGSASDSITAGGAGAAMIGGGEADTLTGTAVVDDRFILFEGDFVSGETISDRVLNNGDNDNLEINGDTDLTVGTVEGIEHLEIGHYTYAADFMVTNARTLVADNVVVTITGDQLVGFKDVTFADDGAGDTLNVTATGNFDFSAISLIQTTEDIVNVNGGGGGDTITAFASGSANFLGGGDGDTLRGAGGYWNEGTLVRGQSGNDLIDYGSRDKAVTLDGGGTNQGDAGDFDTLVGSVADAVAGGVTINLGLTTGDQTIGDSVIANNFENVDFTNGGMLVATGSAIANQITGSAFADTIDGLAGLDVISGLGGNDKITFRSTAQSIAGGTGVDTLVLKGAANVELSTGESQTWGTGVTTTGFEHVDASLSTTAVTLRGLDFVSGSTAVGGSILVGGSGNDSITAGVVGTIIVGAAGMDTLIGSAANNRFVILGGDFVAGESIADSSSNDDLLYVLGSTDLSIGTISGLDHLLVTSGGLLPSFFENGGYFQDGGAVTVTLTGTQLQGFQALSFMGAEAATIDVDLQAGVGTNLGGLTVTGMSADDRITITGTAGTDQFTGSNTAEIIDGGTGGDLINTADGNDSVVYYTSATLLIGGNGEDTLVLKGAANILLDAADQTVGDVANVSGFEHVDASASIVSVTLSGADGVQSRLIGGSAADTISASDGGAIMTGGGGSDTISAAGAVCFIRWNLRSEGGVDGDSINGFSPPAGDKLQFAASQFSINGTDFDSVVDGGFSADISDADLFRTTSVFADAEGLNEFLRSNGQGVADQGLFVLGVEAVTGNTVLYYTADASGNGASFAMADFGTSLAPTGIGLSDFGFFI